MRSVMVDLPADVSDEEARLLVAIGLFVDGRVSAAKAAEIAGYSRRAFMEILSHRGIPAVNYPDSEVEEDLRNA